MRVLSERQAAASLTWDHQCYASASFAGRAPNGGQSPPKVCAKRWHREHKLNSTDARDQLIVALDFPTARQALDLVDRLDNTCRWFKVGLELFYAAGSQLVSDLRRRDHQVFLDLKLHDIPNTVAAAVRTVSKLDVQLLTVHASGGREMLASAQDAAQQTGSVALLGVTVLTSMNGAQLNEVGVAASPAEQVLRLAELTRRAGLSGIVCSPLEATDVRAALGPEAMLVVPGVRSVSAPADDQKRVATPADAMRSGASMLVVGRPITRASDPAMAAAHILEELRTSARTS